MCWKETAGVSLRRNTVVTDVRMWVDTFVYFVESELAPQTSYPILIGQLSDTTREQYKGGKCIYYNTEQLSRDTACSIIIKTIQDLNPVEVWDYSKENVDILCRFGVNARHVRLQCPTWYKDELRTYRKQGTFYDVGFAGIMTQRRLHILKKLEDAGLIVRKIDMFGKERDKELGRCAFILNIHAMDDYCIFESARCEPWLSIGVPVISESSMDNDPRCILTDYDYFVQTTLETVKTRNYG